MSLRRFTYGLVLTALFVGLLFTGIFAGTVGKITGTVIDEEGVGIPGVAVQIEGTTMGAAASFDGSYVILNVPVGTYTLVAQSIGYNKMTVKEIRVQADLTMEMNFQLTSEAIPTDDITVIGKRAEIDKYITSNVEKISADKISSMPVVDISDVLRRTTGFVSQGELFHARGGRGGEIAFMVDGVEIRDVLGGLTRSSGNALKKNVDISATDIEELSVLKGSFDAEYGGVNSAIINVVRKEGDIRTTTGRVEFITDDFGFNDLNKYSFNSDRLEWNLSGPVPGISDQLFPALGLRWPGEKMAYFVSFSTDRSNNYIDYNEYSSAKSKIDYGYEKFLGIKIPMRRSNKYSASAKLTWKMDTNARYRISFNYMKLWQKYTNFDWDFLFTPQTAHRIEESKELYGVTFTFSPDFLKNTFGELKFNRYVQDYDQRPGGKVPGDFVMADNYESYADANNNGRWDAAEPFVDVNGDGFFGEPFLDGNNNGVYDPGPDTWVAFDVDIDGDTTWMDDLNRNGRYDDDIGEPYSDLNGNGRRDRAEPVYNDHFWHDVNGNGVFDEGDSTYVDTDGLGNGAYDPELRDVINEDRAEPFTDGDVIIGEPYIDVDFNGVFNGEPNDPNGPDVFIGAWDLNNNGRHDGPFDPWSEGIPYRDLNNNGSYDAPNGFYDYGEPYVDLNDNGRHDYADGFIDHGFLQWAVYQKTKTAINTFSMDLTSQVAKEHEIKSGIEFKDMHLEMGDLRYPDRTYDGMDDGGPWLDRGIFRDFYTRTPKQGAFYFRDKMEYGEMIANLGFRYDFYIQANEIKSVDFEAENLADKELADSKNKFSPRIAFSFPVSDKAKLYFNYGHFFQLPELNYFYRRPTQASNAFGIIGNPNLDFEKTIQYEVGLQYRVARGYIMTISGFYKDYYGLLNSIQESYGPITNDVYGNIDYARSRGVEFQLEKRYAHFFAGSFDYEYTWAFGKNSSASADYFRRFMRQEIPTQETPLDWDIRHQVTVTTDIRATKGNHPKIGIFTLPDDWTFNIIWQFKTGLPFTPDVNYPGLILVGQEVPLNNSRRMPYYSTVDIRLDKNFQVWELNYTLSLRVDNMFDNKNVNNVFSSTGLPYTDQNNNGQIWTGIPMDADPSLYDPGRQIQVGMSLNF